MRLTDENKKKAIAKAAIYLINTEGINGISMSKIAARAGVSASTIYTYYENKEEMLINLYLAVKEQFSIALNNNFSLSMTIKEGFRVLFENIIEFYKQNPDLYYFIEQFSRNPLAEKVCEDALQKYFGSILQFVNKGIEKNIIKNISHEFLSAFVFPPVAYIINEKKRKEEKITQADIDTLFDIIWDALKA